MSDDIKKNLIDRVRDLAFELGKTPTKVQFENSMVGGKNKIEKYFGTYTDLIKSAGLSSYDERRSAKFENQVIRMQKEYKALCSKKEQIHGFFVHDIDIDDLFKRAGNPKFLKVIAQPDTHVKFIDKSAYSAFEQFCEWMQPDVHIIMGDFLDCEGLSHWDADTLEPRRIVPEIISGKKLIERFVEKTPKCSSRIYLTGNHEHWIDMAFNKMPELFDGLAELGIEINLKTMLGLEKLGYQLFELNHLIKIGKAHFTHGIYTGTHHAKKHIDVFKTNIYYGHLHDNQEHNQTSVTGPMEAASLGCLCRLDAKFLKGKPNNWVHSFGIYYFFRDGSYTYYRPKILNGVFAFGDRIFDGNKNIETLNNP